MTRIGRNGRYPRLDIATTFEIENDFAFSSDDPGAELNDIFATIEPAISVKFNDTFSLEAGLTFEPVAVPDPGKDRFFGDHGLYVSDLYLSLAGNRLAVWAGKFGARFGQAWEVTPGVFGTDFAEDYELAERIGLGGSVSFGGDTSGR